MCALASMQSNGKHDRMSPPVSKAQTFSCGIFGVCSPFLSSPRTPPLRVPNNSEDFTASDILLIQGRTSDQSCDLPNPPVPSAAETPNFYSLNIITRSGADSGARISPLISNSTRTREFTEIELAKRSPVRDFADPNTVDNLLTRIKKGSCSKSALEALLKHMIDKGGDDRALEEQVASALISLLTSTILDECFKHTESYEEAFAAIVRLAHNENVLTSCAKSEMLEVLDWVLNRGSLVARANAAVLLQKISSNEGLERTVADRQSFLDGVVRLMLKTEQPNACKQATRTLLALCLSVENRCAAVRAGSVAAIMKVIPSAKIPTAEKALATLELLATTAEGQAAMTEHEFLVAVLVSMILKVSDRATEYATGALCAICTGDTPQIQERAVQAGAQTRLLLLLQSQCTQRAKRKALQLLKVLHRFWDHEPRNAESGQTGRIHY